MARKMGRGNLPMMSLVGAKRRSPALGFRLGAGFQKAEQSLQEGSPRSGPSGQ